MTELLGENVKAFPHFSTEKTVDGGLEYQKKNCTNGSELKVERMTKKMLKVNDDGYLYAGFKFHRRLSGPEG